MTAGNSGFAIRQSRLASGLCGRFCDAASRSGTTGYP
jgi:hypothetical protein